MDDKENTPIPQQPNRPVDPFVVRQPERQVPYPFNADREDTSQTSVVETATPAPIASPKKKKKLLIGLILTALVLLGLGLAYVYWYQNPNKVVSDAIINALNAKSLTYTGTATTAGSTKMVATLDGGVKADGGTVNAKFAFDVNDKKYTLDGNGIIDSKNDLYFKVKNIDGLVNNYRQAIPADSQKLFDQIIDKVDDKWIKISSADLKSYSADLAKMQKCTADAAKKIQNDKAVKSEVMDAYKKHPFISIDKALGAKDGSLGYLLSTDVNTSKAFNKEFKNTSLYKSLVKCDGSFEISDEDIAKASSDKSKNDTKIELWVNQWDHQISRLVAADESKDQPMNISVSPKFNQPVTITTPKESTTIERLQKDVMQLLQGPQSAPAAAPAPQS